MDRRKFVKGAGALVTTGAIAGCLGNQQGSADNEGGQATTGQGGNASAQGSGQGDIGEFFDLDGNIAQNSDPNLEFLHTRLVRTGGQNLGGGQGGGSAGVFDFPWVGEQGGAGVIGAIRNTADRPMTFAEVTATLYDQGDNVLGTWGNSTEEARVQFLRPNQTWTFRIWFESVDLSKAARYTLSADGQLANNSNLLGSGEGNYLFDGNAVDIGPNGQVTTQNGQTVGEVTVLQDNQAGGQGFENVRVLPNGQVVNQQGVIVGAIEYGPGERVMDAPGGTNGTNGSNSSGGS